MAHYAQTEDTSNPDFGVVVQVIVAEQDFIATGALGDPSRWIQTSYNSRGGVHYGPNGEPDGLPALRANYAGIGYIHDRKNDVFYAPQPYPSWTISAPAWLWSAPVAYPTDGKQYVWNEAVTNWTELTS